MSLSRPNDVGSSMTCQKYDVVLKISPSVMSVLVALNVSKLLTSAALYVSRLAVRVERSVWLVKAGAL